VEAKAGWRPEAPRELGGELGDLSVQARPDLTSRGGPGDEHHGAVDHGARFSITPKAHAKFEQLRQRARHPPFSETYDRWASASAWTQSLLEAADI